MSDEKKWVLWENQIMSVQAAFNPAIPRSEGLHIVLLQKVNADSPWSRPDLYGRMSVLAARVSGVILGIGMADWVNIHYDGNIGAAKDNPKLHIHIFGRLKTSPSWGGPLQLPLGEEPHGNDPLTDEEIVRFRSELAHYLKFFKG